MEFIEYLLENDYPAHKQIPSKIGDKILKLETNWGLLPLMIKNYNLFPNLFKISHTIYIESFLK